MSYVEKNLLNNEQIVYRANIHWWIFVSPLIGLLIAALCFSMIPYMIVGIIVLLLALRVLIGSLIHKYGSEFAVTNKRVILKKGIYKRESLELMLNKTEGIKIQQGIWGRILGYGTLVVTTGGASNSFKLVASPQKFRKEINEQIENTK